jgi:DNA-binding GntR family transcriptional regulator
MGLSTEAPTKESAPSAVFERLLEMVVELELEPGAVVTEAFLAERLGTSRSSLREAVQRLGETGLLSARARTGISVAPVSLLDVQNVYEARAAIEGQLARLAAERATKADIVSLKALNHELRSAGSPQDFRRHDRQLHIAIGQLGKNPLLDRALGIVLSTNARLWALFGRLNGLGGEGDWFYSHDELVDAIDTGDPDRAEQAVVKHLEASRRLLGTVFWPK